MPGYVDGRHYTDFVDEVRELRSEGDPRAEQLLLRLVDATEDEAACFDFGVAPWYYEQLAIIYRKRGDQSAEIEILERFGDQIHAPGVKPAELMDRLEMLRG